MLWIGIAMAETIVYYDGPESTAALRALRRTYGVADAAPRRLADAFPEADVLGGELLTCSAQELRSILAKQGTYDAVHGTPPLTREWDGVSLPPEDVSLLLWLRRAVEQPDQLQLSEVPPWSGAFEAIVEESIQAHGGPKALPILDLAVALLPCTDAGLDTAATARLLYLRGAVSHRQAALAKTPTSAARRDFEFALTLHPGLAWDDDLFPDHERAGRAVFEEARTKPAATITFVTNELGAIRLDGRPVEAARWIGRSGRHTLEVLPEDGSARRTFILENGAGDDTVVYLSVPGDGEAAPTIEALAWSPDLTYRTAAAGLLAKEHPGDAVYAFHDGSLARLDRDPTDWKTRRAAWASKPAGVVTTAGGALVMLSAIGGLVAVEGMRQSLVDQAEDASSMAGYDQLHQSYRSASDWILPLAMAAGAGGVTLGLGISIDLEHARAR